MPSPSSCRIPVSHVFFSLSHFHFPIQNSSHNNCRINTAWFKSPHRSSVWTWWKSQRGRALAFPEDQKWKITAWRQWLFLRPHWENAAMNSSCSFMCTNLYSGCFININICWKVGCFVYVYAHLFVLELLEERRYTVHPLACHMTLCKSSKLSELYLFGEEKRWS